MTLTKKNFYCKEDSIFFSDDKFCVDVATCRHNLLVFFFYPTTYFDNCNQMFCLSTVGYRGIFFSSANFLKNKDKNFRINVN